MNDSQVNHIDGLSIGDILIENYNVSSNSIIFPINNTYQDLTLEKGNDIYSFSNSTILFINSTDVSIYGNKGKTWFCKWYIMTHGEAQYLEPGKKADMAHALQEDQRILFVNVTRQQVDHLQYSFYESVKDGLVFSSKYESNLKRLPKMHVVIMMN